MASCKYCYSLLALIGLSTSDWVNMTTYPRLPRSTSFMALGSYNDVVFILGGYSTEVSISKQVVQYSATNKNFTDPGKRLNYNVWGGGDFYTQIDNTVYFLSTSGSNLNTFDMANRVYTSSWKSVSTSVSYTSCLTSASISNIDYIYVVGGYGSTPLSKVQVLKTSTMQWLSGIPSMKTARNRLSCIVDPSTLQLYAIAGKNGPGTDSGSYLDTIEKINVNNMNLWEIVSATLTKPAIGTRSILYEERILVIGGRYHANGVSGQTYLDTIHVVDPQTDAVTLPYASLPRGVAEAAAIIMNDELYVFGGSICPNDVDFCYNAYRTFLIYQFATPSPTTPTSQPPTYAPTLFPTNIPTASPTLPPTYTPTSTTTSPTFLPTLPPTNIPTASPTLPPTYTPTSTTTSPTLPPTYTPSLFPTNTPTLLPTLPPTSTPTSPTTLPTLQPTYTPSESPSNFPTYIPTSVPSNSPTLPPVTSPTALPTTRPSLPPTQTSKPSSVTDADGTTDRKTTDDAGNSNAVNPSKDEESSLIFILILSIVLIALIVMHFVYRYRMKKRVQQYKKGVKEMKEMDQSKNNDRNEPADVIEPGHAAGDGLGEEGVVEEVANRRREGSCSVQVIGGTTKGGNVIQEEDTLCCEEYIGDGQFVVRGDESDDEVHETIQ
eukprot:745433_1